MVLFFVYYKYIVMEAKSKNIVQEKITTTVQNDS